MEYRIENEGQGACRLVCSYTDAEVLKTWKNAANSFASSFRMPGFRPGKAPLAVIEKQFGRQISDMVTDTLVARAVSEALKSSDVMPVTRFDFQGGNAMRGNEFRFDILFGVLPDFDCPALDEIKVEEAAPAADPVQEGLFMREFLSRAAETVEITEGTPQDGDIVSGDVKGTVNGNPVPGLNGPCRMRLIAVAPGEKAPDLDPIVRGLHIGETGKGSTLCPDNYPEPSLRGKPIELSVTLRKIERETLPELNDETARKLGFRSIEAMQMRAHEQALDMDRMHKRSQALQSIQAVLENWQGFDAPASMVTECERDAMRRSRQYLQQQYGDSDTFKSSLAQMKQEAAETGARKARCRALLLRWAREHGVALAPEELDAVLRGRAARQNKSPEEYLLGAARTGEVFGIQAAMLEEKALYALFDAIRNTANAAE